MIELVHRFKSSYTGFAFLYTVLLYSIGVGLALALSEPLEQSHQNTAIAVLGVFLLLQVSLQAWFAAKKLKNS
jgi:heme A synthase